MKSLGILLIGFGTISGIYLSVFSPEQRLDSTFLFTIAGIWFLTMGLIVDKLTSQHSNTHK